MKTGEKGEKERKKGISWGKGKGGEREKGGKGGKSRRKTV